MGDDKSDFIDMRLQQQQRRVLFTAAPNPHDVAERICLHILHIVPQHLRSRLTGLGQTGGTGNLTQTLETGTQFHIPFLPFHIRSDAEAPEPSGL